MFWCNDSSCALAKVPINPSVRTIPRTTSLSKVLSRISPSGRSTKSRQAASFATRSFICARDINGCVNVGNIVTARSVVRS